MEEESAAEEVGSSLAVGPLDALVFVLIAAVVIIVVCKIRRRRMREKDEMRSLQLGVRCHTSSNHSLHCL